ncbi:hypothetical protein Taro_023802 [Colocasia esculenta]|uniref:Uncharacterized protein n=1 Tax=Colocasia esculenta TaxID=4460 RepID=A0A843V5N7_COLES|nr:hypothetical protein [Colocasia esculenta]
MESGFTESGRTVQGMAGRLAVLEGLPSNAIPDPAGPPAPLNPPRADRAVDRPEAEDDLGYESFDEVEDIPRPVAHPRRRLDRQYDHEWEGDRRPPRFPRDHVGRFDHGGRTNPRHGPERDRYPRGQDDFGYAPRRYGYPREQDERGEPRFDQRYHQHSRSRDGQEDFDEGWRPQPFHGDQDDLRAQGGPPTTGRRTHVRLISVWRLELLSGVQWLDLWSLHDRIHLLVPDFYLLGTLPPPFLFLPLVPVPLRGTSSHQKGAHPVPGGSIPSGSNTTVATSILGTPPKHGKQSRENIGLGPFPRNEKAEMSQFPLYFEDDECMKE